MVDTVAPLATAPDADSQEWLDALAAEDPARRGAVERLHALLLRAARFEIRRRRGQLPGLGATQLEDLAVQSADDALMAVLRKLGDYRGASRFTTWAYKFALLEASSAVRRRTWDGVELPLTEDGLAVLASRRQSPHAAAQAAELLDWLERTIRGELTERQREVLVALTLNDVPLDVLAERLETTRGALYKMLHDARAKLRAALARDGLTLDLDGDLR